MCTIAPPYEIEEIDGYFKDLYEDLGIGGVPNMMANFATINHVLEHYTEKYGDCKTLQLEAFSRAVEHYVSYCTSGRRDELGPVYRSLFDRNLANLYRRSNSPIPEKIGLNACCAPGVRKLYVTATGEYLPCERMSYDYVIGHADRGIEHDLVDDLYKDLGAAVKDRCLNCWAIRLCSLCFTHLMEKKDGSGLYVPIQFCEYMRGSKEEELRLFLGMHQANPESLEFLKEFTFE
jgi:radical SAM protein with 4Fe4S-binding SPASM domain